jgi:hypothetical protein
LGDLSINGLCGKGRGGGCGLLDLLLVKLDLLDELINNQADAFGLASAVKVNIKETLDCHASYREHCGENADMTWVLTMPASAKEFAEFPTVDCRQPNNTHTCQCHLHTLQVVAVFMRICIRTGHRLRTEV